MNKLSSALGALAVIAICVVFILQFRPASNATRTDTGPDCAVTVRGTCISAAWFRAASRLAPPPGADPGRLRAMGFGKKVADGLLEAWLLNQDAKRLGMGVSDDEVTREIGQGHAHVSLPVADQRQMAYSFQLVDGAIRQIPVKNGKTKKFDARLAEKNIRTYTQMSPAEFREYQRSEILAERMRQIVKSRVRVAEAEAFEAFSQEKSTVTLDYIRFAKRFYRELVVDASRKAVDAWADGNKDEIDKVWEARKAQIMPECRNVREIYVRLDEAATDEDKAKARAKIDRARARIEHGEDFAEVAAKMSDVASGAFGGDVGCFAKGRRPKPYEDAVNALAAGKVSDVVTTERGFFLIKLEQIAKDADAEKLARAQIARELYVDHEVERLTAEAAKNVAAAVKGGKTMKDALDLYLAELAQSAPKHDDQKADDKKADDKKNDKKADDKKKGDDKKADDKNDDDRPVYTFANHPDRPIIETTLPFNASSSDFIPGLRAPSDLARTVFALEKPGDMPSDVTRYDEGYLVVQLKEKTPASKEQWEKNRELYLGAMRAAKQDDALTAYVKRLSAQLGSDAKYTSKLVDDKPAKPGENAPAPIDDDMGE